MIYSHIRPETLAACLLRSLSEELSDISNVIVHPLFHFPLLGANDHSWQLRYDSTNSIVTRKDDGG